jgi:hypothetical protein
MRKLNTRRPSDFDDCRAIAVKGDVARRGRGGLIDVHLYPELGHARTCRHVVVFGRGKRVGLGPT